MDTRPQEAVRPAGQGTEKTTPEVHSEDDDACRCKATAEMTPKELLKLMWSDLAFWKKKA